MLVGAGSEGRGASGPFPKAAGGNCDNYTLLSKTCNRRHQEAFSLENMSVSHPGVFITL